MPRELIAPRDFFGIALVQMMIPLAAITSAIAYDLTSYFARSIHISLIILFVLSVSLAEIAFIAVDKTAAANILVGLWKAGLIAYPIQTGGGAFSVRAPGLFYSAFTLALFCTWVVTLGIFRPQRSLWWTVLAMLAAVVLAFTINRNGIIMCGAVVGLRLIFGGNNRISEWKIGLAGLLAAAFIVLVPAVSLMSDISTADDSVYGKTSTMATRANTWNDLLSNQWVDLGIGTGSVQGVVIEGRDPVLVDNFFLYVAYQDGIVLTVLAAVLLFLTFWQLLQNRRQSDWIRTYVAMFVAGAIGFALNIVFFEPIYPFLYLAPILSLIVSTQRMTVGQDETLTESINEQATLSRVDAMVQARDRRSRTSIGGAPS